MLRLLDRNHVPQVPKSYTFPNGKSVPWDSKTKTFDVFAAAVQNFAVANGLDMPSVETIEDQICKRLPRGWCSGMTRFDRPPSLVGASRPARKPCRSCGRR